MKFTSLLSFLTLLLLSISCSTNQNNELKLNSSVEILSKQSYPYGYKIQPLNDSQYIELEINKLRIKRLSDKALVKEIDLIGMSEYNMPLAELADDSLLYIVKTPDGISKKNPDIAIAIKLNLNTWSITDSFAIHDRLMDVSKDRLMNSMDSIVRPSIFTGLVYQDQKLFFPLFRWISMNSTQYFSIEMPSLAYYDLNKKKVVYTNLTPPRPKQNNLLEIHNRPSITRGANNQILVYFQYSDSVAIYDITSGNFEWKSTTLPYTTSPEGLTPQQIATHAKEGISFKHDQIPFGDIFFDSEKEQYIRFGKVELENMIPAQRNFPLYNYTLYDTDLNPIHTGILPRIASPIIVNYEANSPLLLSSRTVNKPTLYEFDFQSSPTYSYTELEHFKNIGNSKTGWPAYFDKVHKNIADTIRTLIIPEESCPTCIMAVLTREQGIETMNHYGYNMLFLSNEKYASRYIDVTDLKQKLPTQFDSHQYMSYINSFTNPKLLVIANGKVIVDQHMDPEASHSLEEVITNAENSISAGHTML